MKRELQRMLKNIENQLNGEADTLLTKKELKEKRGKFLTELEELEDNTDEHFSSDDQFGEDNYES